MDMNVYKWQMLPFWTKLVQRSDMNTHEREQKLGHSGIIPLYFKQAGRFKHDKTVIKFRDSSAVVQWFEMSQKSTMNKNKTKLAPVNVVIEWSIVTHFH